MIVTVTLNPSLDRTLTLDTSLARGSVHRVTSVTTEPGGKGVNVSRALIQNTVDTVALLPANDTDVIVSRLRALHLRYRNLEVPGAVRTNLTVTETDGTTTKFNEPGAHIDSVALDALTAAVSDFATRATWVVLSGSLPPGVPDDWYAQIASLRIMAAVMAAGMVPPLAMALASTVRSRLFTEPERENGRAAWLLGACFMSEGAIPFAAADPLRVIPSMMFGGAVTGALVMTFDVTSKAPHGGIFVFFAIGNLGWFLAALLAGTVCSALAVIAAKSATKAPLPRCDTESLRPAHR